LNPDKILDENPETGPKRKPSRISAQMELGKKPIKHSIKMARG